MTAVWTIAGLVLAAAALLTSVRIFRGPSTLDRMVALDALVAEGMCGLAVWAAYSHNSTVVPGIVALGLTFFIGSIAVVRFRVPDQRTTLDRTPGAGGAA